MRTSQAKVHADIGIRLFDPETDSELIIPSAAACMGMMESHHLKRSRKDEEVTCGRCKRRLVVFRREREARRKKYEAFN